MKAHWPSRPGFTVAAPGEKVAFDSLVDGNSFLVFDVETVRDPMFPVEYKEDGVTEKFPNAAQMQVVSVVGLVVDGEGNFRTPVIFGRGRDEEARVWDFARYLRERPGTVLVSWNGRSFDAPVITARLMRYGWPSPFYDASYRKRYDQYGQGIHLDLCDQLSDFGAGTRAGLGHYARLIGLPGKVFGEGSAVADMVSRGEQDLVDYYCLTDVLQTGFVHLRSMLSRGDITREQYRAVAASNLALCRDVFGEAAIDEGRLLLTEKKSQKGEVAA